MFHYYDVFYDGNLIGRVKALSENSALEKGARLAGVSASLYSGRASRLVSVYRVS